LAPRLLCALSSHPVSKWRAEGVVERVRHLLPTSGLRREMSWARLG